MFLETVHKLISVNLWLFPSDFCFYENWFETDPSSFLKETSWRSALITFWLDTWTSGALKRICQKQTLLSVRINSELSNACPTLLKNTEQAKNVNLVRGLYNRIFSLEIANQLQSFIFREGEGPLYRFWVSAFLSNESNDVTSYSLWSVFVFRRTTLI